MKPSLLFFILYLSACSNTTELDQNIEIRNTQHKSINDQIPNLKRQLINSIQIICNRIPAPVYNSRLHITIHDKSSIHNRSYNQIKEEIKNRRSAFKKIILSDTSKTDSVIKVAQDYLFNKLTIDVLPSWYGTPWDFNGISNQPKKGQIACGYFVSTPLKHIGFNLNRYRVAQKGAKEIIETLAGKEGCKTFTNKEQIWKEVTNRPDGIYIIGLSSHVGFIEKRKNMVYFTHSNYLTPCEVIREEFLTSPAIYLSHIYVLGDLSLSSKVILNWINEISIKV